MPSFAVGARAFPISTELGLAVDFSVLSAAASTVVGATSSATLKTGGPSVPAMLIGSDQHYGDALSIAAIADAETAYNYYKALTPVGNIYVTSTNVLVGTSPVFSGDMNNLRFTEGVYSGTAGITNSGTVTFDAEGHPYAKFVIQVGAAYAAAASTNIILINGAKAANVFWVITGAPTVGANSHHEGTIISLGAITIGDGTSINGRLLTIITGAISIDDNVIYTQY
jgi:hypothetical protein